MELSKKRRPLVILSAVLSSLAAVFSFVPYLAIYNVIREILSVYPEINKMDIEKIGYYSIVALLGILGNLLSYFLAILCSHIAAFGTIYDLKITFAEHLARLPLGVHLNIGSGKLRKIMEDNIDRIEGFIAHQFPDFVASVVSPIVMVIILLTIDWRFGLASLLGIILAFVAEFMGYGSGEMKNTMKNYQDALEDMTNASVEFVRGMPVIKIFGREDSSFERLKEAIGKYTDWVLKFSLGWQNCMPAFTTIVNNIYLFLIPVGLLLAGKAGDKPKFLLNFIFYLLFVPAIAGILNKIMYVSESFMEINNNVARMDEILYMDELEDKGSSKPEGFDVSFENISFSYEERDKRALSDVSFTAKEGQFTAVVGSSGSGKSTIANLISRFWDKDDGKIRIGGAEIKDISYKNLMESVSFVYQDTFLFKMSIADNIRIGRRNASINEVMKAAEKAQCHEFISKLPDGYNTRIGAKGVHLSGGEKQRIAIARAILKDSPIIVLDEATAFSDPENEYLIKKAFENLTKEKTIIMIAHRLSTVKNADQILVMEEGRLVEKGTHDELYELNGRYRKLWDSYTETLDWKVGKTA
ncbi:MAG TPA: ABC transporter ATP-binding protein [Lachnospiraceae bacterium]|nr:ABC transporter ATP-binding protein [Lachnospiraceae bacterium]